MLYLFLISVVSLSDKCCISFSVVSLSGIYTFTSCLCGYVTAVVAVSVGMRVCECMSYKYVRMYACMAVLV